MLWSNDTDESGSNVQTPRYVAAMNFLIQEERGTLVTDGELGVLFTLETEEDCGVFSTFF